LKTSRRILFALTRTALLVAVLGAPFLARVAVAQSMTFGTAVAVVTDAAGTPLEGVDVQIVDRASGAMRAATTGRDGRVRFSFLAAARYDVSAEALGFHPLVHLGVTLRAGSVVTVAMRLRAATPPVATRDTVRARAANAPPLAWLYERGYADLAGGRRTLGDVAQLAPTSDRDGIEGLPWRLADVVVDGARIGGASQPASSGSETIALALPIRAMSDGAAGGVGFDAELSGTGTGLRGNSLRAGHDAGWSALGEGGTANYGGTVMVGGAVQRDTAFAMAGAEYQRIQVATPALMAASDAVGLGFVEEAATTHGINLGALTRPTDRIEERWSGFTRFDWLEGNRFAVSFRASGSRLTLRDPASFSPSYIGLGSRQDAVGATAALTLLARVLPTVSLEFRVSGDVAEAWASTPSLVPTTFVGRGVTVGGADDEPYSESRTTPRATGIVHWTLGAHRLKAGLAVVSDRVEGRGTAQSAGRFYFGDPADLEASNGVHRSVTPATPSTAYRLHERALFVQDAWTVTDALSLTAGVRVESYRMPPLRLAGAGAWGAASGFTGADFETRPSRIGPRLGFRWALGAQREWVLEGGAGVFHHSPERRDLLQVLTLGNGAAVRTAVGPITSWPQAPLTSDAGQTLALLGTRFEGPRTQRYALGIQRTVGAWTTYATAVHRHTDFLSRVNELNRPAVALGTDQYGRPLYGQLQRIGSVLWAVPGSNRRFADFESVHALDASGYSSFASIALGVDRVVEHGLSFALNYTFGRTRDNLPADGMGERGIPLSEGLGDGDWSDGVSDRDAPHRGLVALEWAPLSEGRLRLGAIYRIRSGTPFTPGFRLGVDANGDGDPSNDPAPVDAAAPGMGALLDAHRCLADQAGSFAARNSCRTDWEQRLDLRASVRVAYLGQSRVDLVVDALDVVRIATGRPDAALFLVDRNGTLSTNGLTGVTTVPLVVNPNFGKELGGELPGVLWRVGLRIGR
jgi:hypothetical protein